MFELQLIFFTDPLGLHLFIYVNWQRGGLFSPDIDLNFFFRLSFFLREIRFRHISRGTKPLCSQSLTIFPSTDTRWACFLMSLDTKEPRRNLNIPIFF